ncbi:putative spore germination protein YfkR [Paenibacillus sp. J31TS4]|uniref:Ger(x)C family spore germination protein n=1 Tax=Paenibacillus sp. J31TS4 TaxID=2807195 RepID=UPI001B11BD89|nr:Ger(x)C family spore germination protein [Paenibacillus sp. J31TS4]GIP39996.1 putative spore germination protein YfkR [Paenibacillus sp. J31TS4]
MSIKPTRIAKRAGVLLAIPLLLLTAGCWDRREVNDTAFVLASAIDYEPNGQYRVSIGVPLAGKLGGGKGGGGGSGGDKPFFIDSDTGPTINISLDKLQSRMSRRLILNHRRVLMIGEDMARQVGLRDVMDVIARSPENRLSAYLIVTKGSADSVLRAEPQLERFSAEAAREMVKTYSVATINLKDVAQALMQTGTDPIIPCLAEVKKKSQQDAYSEIQMSGYAIFKGFKMVDLLEGESAKGVGWLKEDRLNGQYFISISTEEGQFAINMLRGSTTTHVERGADGRLSVTINSVVKGAVGENLSSLSVSETSTLSMLQNKTADAVKRQILQALEPVRKHGADFPGFGLQLKRHNPKQWEQARGSWDQLLREAAYTVNVRADIVQTGLTTENISRR